MLVFFVLGALFGGLTMTVLMACFYISSREEKDGEAQRQKRHSKKEI
jgi:hypothetical protein